MKTPRILTASIAALISLPVAAQAVDYIWTANPGNNDWNDSSNWDFNGVPVSGFGNNIFIHTPGIPGTIQGVALDADRLFMAVGTAGDPTTGYNFGAGTYNLGTLYIGEGHIGNGHVPVGPIDNAYGRAFINAGTTINVGAFHLGEWDGASGHVIQSGGDVNISGQFRLGHWPQAGGATNSYDLNGGTITMTGANGGTGEGANGNIILGIDSSGILTVNNGTLTGYGITMQTRGASGGESKLIVHGGVVNIAENGITTSNPGNLGSYDIQLGGGTLRATANWSSNLEIKLVTGGSGAILDTTTRTVTLSGNLVDAGGLTKVGTGTLKLTGANTFAGGLTVNSGSVQVGDGGTSGTLGSGAVVLNSPGSLTYSRTDAQTFANAVSGNGSLTVASGTLRLPNLSGSVNPSVNPGATFGTSGTAGTVVASAGSTLEAGVGGTGDFTAGSMLLFGNTLKVSAGTSNTKFIVTNVGGLSAFAASVIQVNPVNLTAGLYPLIDYSGAIGGGGFGNFSLSGLPSRAVGGLVDNVVDTRIDLNITAIDFPIWTGAVDDVWNGATLNWKLGVGVGSTNYQNLDTVLFNDTATGSTTVSLAAAFTPSSVTFNNSVLPYTLTGPGSLGGTTGITKQGSERVIIANTGANTFTGPTIIQAGTLQVGNGTAGSLGIDTTVSIGTAGTLELDLPAAANYNTPTSGTGVVRTIGVNSFNIAAGILSGSPTLDIATSGQAIGVNNQAGYNGIISITGGYLRALGTQALGTDVGVTTISTGGTLDVNGFDLGAEQVFVSGDGAGGAGAIVNNGGGSIFNLHKVTLSGDASIGGLNRWDIRNTGIPGELLDLAGFKLTKVGGNQVSLVGVNATAGDIDINAGTFGIELGSNVQGAGTITLNPGGTLGLWANAAGGLTRNIVANGGSISELGSEGATVVDSPISMQADLTVNVGGANTVLSYLGNLTESGGPRVLNVNGPGRFILLGTNAWTGGYNVNSGVLQVGNGTTTGNLGTGAGIVNGTLVFARTDATTITDSINAGGPAGTMILVADGAVTLAAGTDVKLSSLQSGVNGQDNTLGGTLNIGPGTSLLVQDTFVLGNTAGGGVISHGIINQTGGTVDVNAQNTDGRNFVLGHWGTGQGTYNLSAGTLTSPNISMAISWDGDGAFNLSGTGIANVLGLRFGHNPGRSGVFNLTGGELNLGAEGIWAQNGGFPNDLNLGGGIVRAMASAPITEPLELTGINGDVTFDTNGNTLTLTGALSGAGGFIKNGAGRMVLNASNSATGIFTVNAGTLALVGDYAADRIPANGIVQVNNGSTLEFGSVNVVDPSANYFVNSGSTLTNAASVAHVHVGAVQLDGSTWTTDPASGSYDGENYQFDGATVSVVGTAPSFITQQGGTPADRGISWLATATFDVADVTTSSAADLIVSTELENADSGAAALVKTGAGTMSLTWANSYSGGTTINTGTLGVFADAALGAPAGGVAVDNGATLQADGNVTSSRTFTLGAGGGQIDTGANTVSLDATSTVTGTSLTKLGTGALTLAGTQTYTTLTTSDGTTNVDSPLGTGTSTINANADTNISVSQTLAALNIGAGATVVLTASPSPGEAFESASSEAATAAVPEPGTAGLLLIGALGVLGRRRRA